MRSGKDFCETASSNRMVFINRLKMVMLHDNITQHELSEKTGISQPTISRICTRAKGNYSSPRLEDVIKIAKALSVSLDWLCGLEDD